MIDRQRAIDYSEITAVNQSTAARTNATGWVYIKNNSTNNSVAQIQVSVDGTNFIGVNLQAGECILADENNPFTAIKSAKDTNAILLGEKGCLV